MEQIVCLNEGCCNPVKQTSKYTKRKYCSLECTKEANNKKHQELRKTERKLGLVKKNMLAVKLKWEMKMSILTIICQQIYKKN